MRDDRSWSDDPPAWGNDPNWDAPPSYGPPSRPRVPPDPRGYPPDPDAPPAGPPRPGYPPGQRGPLSRPNSSSGDRPQGGYPAGQGYPPQAPYDPQWDSPPQAPGYPPAPQGDYPPPQRPPYPPQRPNYPPPQRPDYAPQMAPGYEDQRYGPPQRPAPPPQWGAGTPSRPRPSDDGGYGPPPRANMMGTDAPGGYAPLSRSDAPPAQWDRPAVHDIDTERVARVRPEHERAAPARKRGGWSLPIEHIVLAAGILAMYLALSQPWGVDAHGARIFLTGIPRQTALYATLGLTGLGGLLVLLNKRMGCFALLGCLGLFVIPLLVAAGVGGFTVLTQLHVVPQIALSNVHATNRGFFLWWGGLVVTVAGLALQVITHRRKGLIGI